MADPHFIQRLQRQDEASVVALVERFYTPVAQYLVRLVGDRQLAEDLTQETFLDAYVALPRLRDDSNLSAWLFQIATNRARKQLRRQRIIHWLTLGPLFASPVDLAGHVSERDLIGQALTNLTDDQRICLLLHSWAGLSCAEIGVALGKSEAAIKMTLVRARRRFRAAYTGDDQP